MCGRARKYSTPLSRESISACHPRTEGRGRTSSNDARQKKSPVAYRVTLDTKQQWIRKHKTINNTTLRMSVQVTRLPRPMPIPRPMSCQPRCAFLVQLSKKSSVTCVLKRSCHGPFQGCVRHEQSSQTCRRRFQSTCSRRFGTRTLCLCVHAISNPYHGNCVNV